MNQREKSITRSDGLWVKSQMVSVLLLANEIAGYNVVALKESLAFVWKVLCANDFVQLYEISGDIPRCLGEAAQVPTLGSAVGLNDEAENLIVLRNFYFDPVDAESIYMAWPFAAGNEPISSSVFRLNRGQVVSAGERWEAKETLQKKVGQLRELMLKKFGELAKNRPKDFWRWTCELVLGVKDDENPFSRAIFARNEQSAEWIKRSNSYLATAILKKIEKNDRDEKGEVVSPADFISLADFVFEDLSFFFSYVHPSLLHEDMFDLNYFAWSFFERAKESLQSSLAQVSELVWNGVPLYRKQNDGEWALIPDSDEISVFLRMCGQHQGMPSCNEPPKWMETVFFSSGSIDAYHMFFNFDKTPTEEQRRERRLSLRKFLDVSGGPEESIESKALSSSFGTGSRRSTKMMSLVGHVQNRWYGENYIPSDPETVPRQKDVVAWLMSEHDLSKREAEAIDIVTRPDQYRK